MGASTYVVGIRDLDAKFNQMWAIKEQCQEAGVSLPKEVIEYFMTIEEDEYWDKPESLEDIKRERIEAKAREVNLNYGLHITRGDIEYDDGMEFNVADIPDDIKTIRIYMMA